MSCGTSSNSNSWACCCSVLRVRCRSALMPCADCWKDSHNACSCGASSAKPLSARPIAATCVAQAGNTRQPQRATPPQGTHARSRAPT